MTDQFLIMYKAAAENLRSAFSRDDWRQLRNDVAVAVEAGKIEPKRLQHAIDTAVLAQHEIALGHYCVNAILLYELVVAEVVTLDDIEQRYDVQTATIVNGLVKAYGL